MKTVSYVLLLCAIICLTEHRMCAAAEDRLAHIQDAKATKVRLTDVLDKMGRKADCYFTIERVAGESNKLGMRAISVDPGAIGEASTVVDAVGAIKNGLSHLGLTAYRSKENPAVIHILDKVMEKRQGRHYWLNRRVDFVFSGMLYSGFGKLLRRIENVDEVSFFSTGDHGFDYATTLLISAKNTGVRRILSDSIPLSRYSRVLWRCKSTQSGRKVIVTMRFGGQRSSRVKHPAEHLPFAAGEKAFLRTPKSEAGIRSAADYITTQLALKTPHQVRWAMFYLGKHKVAKEIPVLLKHLEYKYTTCEILEEAYPAAGALALMGKEASEAILKEITKQSNDLRLKLLCRLILLVEGPDAGAKAIKTRISTATPARRRARIEATLGLLLKSPHHQKTRDTKAKTQKRS